jgi:hypothetical protein
MGQNPLWPSKSPPVYEQISFTMLHALVLAELCLFSVNLYNQGLS